MGAIESYLKGMGIFFKGFSFFWANKVLRRLAILPVIIVMILMGFGIYSLVEISPILEQTISRFTSSWISEGYFWIIKTFLYISYFFVSLGVLYILSMIVAIPFNSLIAEKTLELEKAEYIQPNGMGDWISFNFQMVITALIKAMLLLVVSIPMLIFSFIPFLSLIAGFYTVLVIAYDSCDYALELKGRKLKQRWQFFKEHFWELAGYTTILSVFFAIPFVNIFLIPVFITSGSLYVSEAYLPQQKLKDL
ncbi:MAG: EI24 domain-containing protein [Bdellovibrionota bacterium]|nr:EI24 domain-containing protein [Bdellovibrionota bacterium]